MTPSELTSRVTAATVLAVAPLAVVGAWLGGVAGAAGVVAGGALALVNFRWLVARCAATVAAPGGAGLWLVGVGARLAAAAAVSGALFATGWAHPVALLAGFSVLPCAVVAHGLQLARRER
jgi:hypothetical protein